MDGEKRFMPDRDGFNSSVIELLLLIHMFSRWIKTLYIAILLIHGHGHVQYQHILIQLCSAGKEGKQKKSSKHTTLTVDTEGEATV